MKNKQIILIGLTMSLFALINANAAFANYNWKDYFSFEQMTAIKKDTNQSVVNKLKTASDWKGVVSGRNIKNGAIDSSKLSSSGCSSGQVLKWDGTTWACSSDAVSDGFITNIKIASDAAIDYSKLNLGSNITSANITDGTIVNADISGSAAIAGSKISPNFGAQNITTSGTIESTSGGIKFPDGTTQTTAAKSSATLCSASTGATTTCGTFALCAIAKETDTASNSYEYSYSCELTDTAGTWTLVSIGENCKAYCL